MGSRTQHVYRFGDFRLDATQRLLCRDGQLVALPPKVFDTLMVLVANSGEVVAKEEMMKQLWPDTFVEEGTLTQYISLLRKALGEGGMWIENHPRRGYRFTAQVEEVQEEAGEIRIEEHTRSRTVVEEEVAQEPGRSRRHGALAAGLVVLSVLAGVAIWTTARKEVRSSFGSVAVLPFRILSGPEDNYLADGITEALITRLANLEGLRVIPYSRVRRFRDSDADAAAIGQELDVEAVIEGTVRFDTGRIRLSVHAVDTKSGYTIWAIERVESDTARLLDIERHLAEAVAVRCRGRLTATEKDLMATSGATNAEAYDLVLRTRRMVREGRPTAALPILERAVRLDPGFADGYGWLAYVQNAIYWSGAAGPETLRAAISSANQALSRDPSSLVAMRALAHIQHSAGREVEGLLMARRALERNPEDLDAMAAAAEAHFRTGLYDRAIPLYEKALAAEPDNPWFMSQLARLHLFLGQYEKGVKIISPLPLSRAGTFGMMLYAATGQMDKAVEVIQSSIKGKPGDHVGVYFGGCVLAAGGDPEGAREIWSEGVRYQEEQLARHENPVARAFAGRMYAALGNREPALRHLERSLAPDGRHPTILFFASVTRALLGERRAALDTLWEAVENGFFNLPMIEFVARPGMGLHSLHEEPGFSALRADLARRVEELRARH
jgi:DNA-binding winged helix-turn-helix (wHTH) protein/TolB-like protein/Flp pilus assembly protein TadD